MKKSLIALAVVGAFSAPAFADPTFYGIVDAGVANVSNTNQRSQTLVVSGGLSTSRLGLRGSEDLGDGLKAVYNLEYALDIASNTGIGSNSPVFGKATAATGATNGAVVAGSSMNIGSGTYARQQMVGLSGGFGTVVAGRLQTTGKDFGDKYDPASGSLVDPLNNLTSANQFMIGSTAALSRASRALAYISPDMEGFKLNLNYVPSVGGTTLANGNLGNVGVASATADANSTALLVSAYYDQGPISVGGVYASVSSPVAATTNASTADRKEYALGGSYDFGMAKVFATYQGSHNDCPAATCGTGAGNTDKVWSLTGLIPAGPGAVVVGYANANINTDASGNSDAKSYNLAYLYTLSKTATIYGAYAHVTDGSNSIGAGGQGFSVLDGAIGSAAASSTSSVFALGLKKSF